MGLLHLKANIMTARQIEEWEKEQFYYQWILVV